MGTLHTHILHLPPNTHSKNMSCICALNVVAKAATTGAIKIQPGKKYADIKEAVKAGAVAGCAPFPEGVDAFGFFNGIDAREAQRYADVEITHGRISMLAALGFLVGEQVEVSSAPSSSPSRPPASSTRGRTPSMPTSSSSSRPTTPPVTTPSTPSTSPRARMRPGSTT